MILIDTDVMVDVMRRYTPAVTWLDSLGTEAIGIPGLVAMELLQGCRDQEEQRRVERVLRPYTLYWPGQALDSRLTESNLPTSQPSAFLPFVYPRTARKTARMLRELYDAGFASFS